MPVRTDTNITPPKFFAPTTKAAHKQMLFHNIKDLISVALAYTINYQNDPVERGFIDYLDDVIKMLPMDEQSVPEYALMLFRQMAKRAEKNPLRVVELVDASVPAPEPVRMQCSDGTSTTIEQVNPSTKLQLSSNTAFEFKGNTPAFFPVPVPYTLTFTPAVTKSKSGPVIPAMSYDVLASGHLKERKVPLPFPAEDDSESKKPTPSSSSSVSSEEPKAISVPTFPTSGGTIEQTPVTLAEPSKPATSTKPVKPIPETPKGNAKSKTSNAPRTRAADEDKPQTSTPISATSIPVPSGPSSSTNAPPTVAAGPILNPPGHDASQLPKDKEDYMFAVNHFPPHPHAADGRPPTAGRRAGLQRSYAFMHKSHPDIFWNDAWGEKPQTRPVEGRSQPPAGKQKEKARSDKPSVGGRHAPGRSHSPVRVPSSSSAAVRAVMQMASNKRGKKRAREAVDPDVDDERPNQRRRAGASGDAGPSGSADSPKRLSRRLSGLKKAVMNMAETAFTR